MSNNNNRNNNNNNRRRGRGNNRSQGGGPVNRIDSRARGNAPQMLEKYRKLAQDASMNGDRVQAEYYLQFADHYFRVTADSRAPKDDQRGPRPERGEEEDFFEDEFDRGQQRPEPRRREDQPAERNDQPRNDQGRNDQGRSDQPRSDQGRADQGRNDQARNDQGRQEKREESSAETKRGEAPGVEGEESQPSDNPFTRPTREKTRRPRRERTEAAPAKEDGTGDRLDPSVLPGAISVDTGEVGEDSEEAPAPRRALKPRTPRAPRRKDSDEELVTG